MLRALLLTMCYEPAMRGADEECSTRVLLVDDHLLALDIGRRMLERLGCHVETATDGNQAVDLCQRRAFDLVLMDGQMPVMTGMEATARIRNLDGATRYVPIVGTSSSDELAPACRDAGMNDFVGKPFLSHKMRYILNSWAEGKYTSDCKCQSA